MKFDTGATDWREFPGEEGGGAASLVAGLNIGIDDTDPDAPIISNEPSVKKSTLLAAAAAITVSSLDGDVEGPYRIDGQLLIAVNDTGVSLKPNSQTSNISGIRGDFLVGPVASAPATWDIARNAADPFPFQASQVLYLDGRIWCRTGRIRVISLEVLAIGSGSAFGTNHPRDKFYINGQLTETAANMTSFQITGDKAVCFAIGSYLRLIPEGLTD